jgi:hypothetical protein
MWSSELHMNFHTLEPPHFHPVHHHYCLFTTTTMPENTETSVLIDQFNDSDDEFIEEIIPFIVTTAVQASQHIEPIRPFSSNNNLYVTELLTTAHPQRCWDVLRMTIETFFKLRDWLLANTLLNNSRKSTGVSIEEKIVIFLYITAHGASAREACERFSYSISTILRLVTSIIIIIILLLLLYTYTRL